MIRGVQLTVADRIELAEKAEARRQSALKQHSRSQGRAYTALEILDFEEKWGAHTGAKESAIYADFGVHSTVFYQRLNRIIDTPAALAARPQLVYRLRAVRDARSEARAARIFRTPTPEKGTA